MTERQESPLHSFSSTERQESPLQQPSGQPYLIYFDFDYVLFVYVLQEQQPPLCIVERHQIQTLQDPTTFVLMMRLCYDPSAEDCNLDKQE